MNVIRVLRACSIVLLCQPMLSCVSPGPGNTDGGSTSTATNTSTPPAVPSASSGTQQTLLDAHNHYRKQHCAAPLEWSSSAAQSAQSWATKLSRKCTMAHQRAGFGENIFQSFRRSADPAEVVTTWYNEVSSYKYRRSPSPGTGHFTQVVWKESTFVGCGKSSCNGGDIWVCFYDPPGNVRGSFQENVAALSCQP